MPLDQRRDVAVPAPASRVTFPVARDSAVVGRSGALADGDGVVDLALPAVVALGTRGRRIDRAGAGARQLPLQHAARLDEQASGRSSRATPA